MCSYLCFPAEIDDSNFVFCCEGCRGHLLAQGSSLENGAAGAVLLALHSYYREREEKCSFPGSFDVHLSVLHTVSNSKSNFRQFLKNCCLRCTFVQHSLRFLYVITLVYVLMFIRNHT